MEYQEFLRNKVVPTEQFGFDIDRSEVNPLLKPHQVDSVVWAVKGGRRALFQSFGLGKTFEQLEIVRITRNKAGGMGLIIMPLGVRGEFLRDAAKLGITVKFVRRIEDCEDPEGIYLTNYETIRDGKMDPTRFTVCSLDEAGCLRGFGGTKTFREFMAKLAGDDHTGVRTEGVKYRFVATATPSPNEFIEILAYAAYLDILDVSQGKTRFFKRDSTKADKLTIHKHKEKEFWLWVSSWALFLQKPSDLGYDDTGYDLPPLETVWHEVKTDHSTAGYERNGQGRLLANSAIGVSEAAREKRASLGNRILELRSIMAQDRMAYDQIVIWVDLDAEQRAVEKELQEQGVSYSSIYGSLDIDEKERRMNLWREGHTVALISKPVMLGAGVNLQQANRAVFFGISFKFYAFIQSVHRIHRFLQTRPCRIDLIYSEAERDVRKALERKWQQHNRMVEKMTEIVKEYGLSMSELQNALKRSSGVERLEVEGKSYKLINNDSILETRTMKENSVGLILTSIPFSTQYEYSPSYADLGHTNNNEHFFEHMDYLTPELLRVLIPGRIAAIHVKDRIVPSGLTGLGFQTVYPFHARCIEHYTKHGFAYMGMKTIVTDVVRENNQTYRLGWTEQCKDGTKMGVGMPEYLLLFRKPPTDTSNGYGDLPVVKHKREYTRSKWQIDAHGFTRSSGNRLITIEDLSGLPHNQIFKLFRQHSLSNTYDFDEHVRMGEAIDAKGRLPVTFMLLQPQSWSPDVWTDITRMLTLNGAQSAKGKEMHLCPMQFDLADRAIIQWSMPGETVFDPFSGLGTVPYRAVLLGRYGLGCELSTAYFLDSLYYCKAAEQKMSTPSLFDLVEDQEWLPKQIQAIG
ncbi:MAG: DNA methylase [Syntrophorhabdus sp. PtaU1.Bin153]|nr:MAG: DNA methylase [Syntrophorhabdus sp. PtaU1.Bin153]